MFTYKSTRHITLDLNFVHPAHNFFRVTAYVDTDADANNNRLENQTLIFKTMKKHRQYLLMLPLVGIAAWVGCKKDTTSTPQVVKDLYATYQNGEISEARLDGQTVYVAGFNAADAGTEIYNKNGENIGTCNYAYGQVDAICSQLQNEQVVYRCKKHITGKPYIDTYGLDK